MRILGKTSSGVNYYSGLLAGSPNYSLGFRRSKRLLYHSDELKVLQYPQIPTKTVGFSHDIVVQRKHAIQETLSGAVVQQWAGVAKDVVITEVYEGDISQTWNWIHELWRFYQLTLSVGGFLLWRPLDLTDRIYRVRILSVTVGGEEMDMTYLGTKLTEKWVSGSLEVKYKILGTFSPSAGIFFTGSTPTGGTTS